jgi:hypothetical protein
LARVPRVRPEHLEQRQLACQPLERGAAGRLALVAVQIDEEQIAEAPPVGGPRGDAPQVEARRAQALEHLGEAPRLVVEPRSNSSPASAGASAAPRASSRASPAAAAADVAATTAAAPTASTSPAAQRAAATGCA